ncbi:hypothetical protein HK099_003665 [Clydaea vesicula]|uniref:O-acyltransferase n=1 Tax=Clydaea vesicula TaxID=447962 RepID=A0AAD5U1E8_9FUNG|nr:hypothetical protein HK099_003665 [Clydaea vesicula]
MHSNLKPRKTNKSKRYQELDDNQMEHNKENVDLINEKYCRVEKEGKALNTTADKKKTRFSHNYLTHTTIRASPLSKESPEQNYRGFLNLLILSLFVLLLRLAIENYTKYGLLITLPKLTGSKAEDFEWCFYSMTYTLMSVSFAFFIENIAILTKSENLTFFLNVCNLNLCLIVPIYISWEKIPYPAISFYPLLIATIVWLKLISYALTNNDLRLELKQGNSVAAAEDSDSKNFKIENSILCPTLVYQMTYPKTKVFRKRFFFKRIGEVIICSTAMMFLINQYASPTLENSLQHYKEMNILRLFERLLKLSIVSLLIWLLMFYAFFHSLLNGLAEVLRFGDRRFYQPWWNASNISEYWRLWNNPVYDWGKRHIYLPLVINHKVSSQNAMLVVFLISAFLHEVLVGIPTHNISGVAFFGMIGQIPLIYLTKWLQKLSEKYSKTKSEVFTTGNIIFWLSFCIFGQPAAVLHYYVEWVKRTRN